MTPVREDLPHIAVFGSPDDEKRSVLGLYFELHDVPSPDEIARNIYFSAHRSFKDFPGIRLDTDRADAIRNGKLDDLIDAVMVAYDAMMVEPGALYRLSLFLDRSDLFYAHARDERFDGYVRSLVYEPFGMFSLVPDACAALAHMSGQDADLLARIDAGTWHGKMIRAPGLAEDPYLERYVGDVLVSAMGHATKYVSENIGRIAHEASRSQLQDQLILESLKTLRSMP